MQKTKKIYSSIESAILFAKRTGAKRIIHVHHSPLRNDDELKSLEELAKGDSSSSLEIDFAKDGMEIIL